MASSSTKNTNKGNNDNNLTITEDSKKVKSFVIIEGVNTQANHGTQPGSELADDGNG